MPTEPALRQARLAHLRDLTIHLVRRELAARHRDSILGWLWAFAPAVIQLLVYQFIFTRVIPLNLPNYGAFLFTGILGWTLFSSGMLGSVGSLEQNRGLALRPGVPRAVVPVTAVLVAVVDYLFALPVLLAVIVLTADLHPAALLLVLPLGIELVLVVGLALAVAPLQVLYRDVMHLVGLVVLVGFWLTPIFYTASQVPERFHLALELNPLAQLIDAQRGLLLQGSIPSPWGLAATGGASVLVLVGGAALFSRLSPLVPERL